MEGEEYHYDVFSMIKDKGVQRIYRFIKETLVISGALNEANKFLDEEVDEYEDPLMPAFDGVADRKTLLCVLLVYTLQEVNELPILINKICGLNLDPPMKDFANTDYYDDENVKLIAAFYNKVLEITDEFKEEVIKINFD
ncbi:MAG TPA: hypothetical protein VMU83_23750 [Hanamia sp.]|nr:hypothetical protein [Hanamia sp.]